MMNPTLKSPEMPFQNVVEKVRENVRRYPNDAVFRFLNDDGVREWTFEELDARARRLGEAIQAHTEPGDRALLVSRDGEEFFEAFFGCLYAGVVAVPVYPPQGARRASSLQRLFAIFTDSNAKVIIAGHEVLGALSAEETLRTASPIEQDRIAADGSGWEAPETLWDSPAMFQYTSGSTGLPKGVVLSHGNLLANQEMLRVGLPYQPRPKSACWLPLFHDMGLHLGLLAPFHGGCATIMSPEAFLKRPARWLEAIGQYGCDITAAPNFAYELCLARVDKSVDAGLDLRSLCVSLNAAEPVRFGTIKRFEARFGPCGLGEGVITPTYGLAEATVYVSNSPAGLTSMNVDRHALEEDRIEPCDANVSSRHTLISVGRPALDCEIRIVDPVTRRAAQPNRVGEIWVTGSQIGLGYWGQKSASEETFRARIEGEVDSKPYLRTGDLGVVQDGSLYITGRVKDVIIVRGRNHYPQDIEYSVERCHRQVRPGCVAAFSMEGSASVGEELVVIAEIRKGTSPDEWPAILEAIGNAITTRHGLHASRVVLAKVRAIPKTSSGKTQRRLCRRLLSRGGIECVFDSKTTDLSLDPAVETQEPKRAATLRWTEFCELLQTSFAVPVDRIDRRATFASLGLDSSSLIELSGFLEARTGGPVSPTLFFDHPTLGRFLDALGHEASSPQKKPSASGPTTAPIAIIGTACRLPGGITDLDSYWARLQDATPAIDVVPPSRWDRTSLQPAAGDVSQHGGFIDDPALFDADFFGISAREALAMDPQQRLLLEAAWEALDDAGQAQEASSVRTGVFAGASSNDYSMRSLLAGSLSNVTPHAGTGNATSVLAGRLSYCLGLRGPAISIDTACSSSLVALHLACQSLRAGDSELAIACGVNLMLSPETHVFFSRLGALSMSGECRPFDSVANGYVRGEGVSVVVLKPLEAAERDGDVVLGVIQGSAINHDGRTNGLTAPSASAQEACIRSACAQAAVAPADLHYVEAHGTGTRLGDPIELKALNAVFSEGRARFDRVAIGSVKSLIGHTEAAAGLAGVLKVLAMMKNNAIPPQAHFENPTPLVDWDRSSLRVATAAESWPRSSAPRLASVSSFGLSGTNAHVVLSDAPHRSEYAPSKQAASTTHLLPISARHPKALQEMASRLKERLLSNPSVPLEDVVFSASNRRAHHSFRAAAVGSTREELVAELTLIATETAAETTKTPIVFVFPGQGSQWHGMARALWDHEAFRHALIDCENAFSEFVDWSLTEVLLHDGVHPRWSDIDFIQPALFAMEVALTAWWRSRGITPDFVVGHSMGEVAASFVAGALTLTDAARVICLRSRLMRRLRGRGAMAVLELSQDEARQWLASHGEGASIAVVNSSRSVVVSGDPATVQALVERAEGADLFAKRVDVDVASHCAQMDVLEAELLEALSPLRPQAGSTPIYSTVDNALVDGSQFNSTYWYRNLRQPVQFASAVSALADRGAYFVEISPHPVLGPAIADVLEDEKARGGWVPSLRREGGQERIVRSCAHLYAAGCGVDFSASAHGNYVPLPSYAFQRERFWLEPNVRSTSNARASSHPMLGHVTHSSVDGSSLWNLTLDSASLPFLTGHKVDGAVVLPAAAYIEMAFAACEERKSVCPTSLTDLRFRAPFVVDEGSREAQLVVSEGNGCLSFQFASRSAESQPPSWTIHVTGSAHFDVPPPSRIKPPRARAVSVGAREFYARLASSGLEYSGEFRCIETAQTSDDQVSATFSVPERHHFKIHPAAIDGALQATSLIVGQDGGGPIVPTHIGRVVRFSALRDPSVAVATADSDGEKASVVLQDADGPILHIEGLRTASLARRASGALRSLRLNWQQRAMPLRGPSKAERHSTVLIVGDAFPSLLEGGDGNVSVRGAKPGSPEFRRCIADCEDQNVEVVFVASRGTTPDVGAELLRLRDTVRAIVDVVGVRLWLVTEHSQDFAERESIRPAHSALWAYAAVARHEHPNLECTSIDVDSLDTDFAFVLHEVTSARREVRDEQIAIRKGERWVARMADAAYAPSAPPTPLREDGTYVITGGFGALGSTIARDFASRGAKHLSLLSRGGACTPTRQKLVRELELLGANVSCPPADTSDREALSGALDCLSSPVVGIVHAAGVLEGGTILEHDGSHAQRVLAPKVLGALNLHALTQDAALDFFVLYSSAAGLLGSPGQSIYAAANGFLDGLAAARRKQNLPALSVRWGPFEDGGLAEAQAHRLSQLGVGGFELRESAAILHAALLSDDVCVTPHRTAFDILAERLPHIRSLGSYAQLMTAGAREDSTLLAELHQSPPSLRPLVAERWLRREIGVLLGRSGATVSSVRGFQDLGVDSLMAVELRNRLQKAIGETLSTTVLWKHASIERLAKFLASKVGGPKERPEVPGELSDVDAMNNDELVAALSQELEGESW